MVPGDSQMKTFTHILMEANSTQIALLRDSHQPVTFIQGYNNLMFNFFSFPPFSIKLDNKLVLLEQLKHKPSWMFDVKMTTFVEWDFVGLDILKEAFHLFCNRALLNVPSYLILMTSFSIAGCCINWALSQVRDPLYHNYLCQAPGPVSNRDAKEYWEINL